MRLQAITAGKRTFAAVAAQRWAMQPRQEETAHHAPVGAPLQNEIVWVGFAAQPQTQPKCK
jgi:hypothetical protein